MGIRYMNAIAEDIRNNGEVKVPANCVTGTAFEQWLYEAESQEITVDMAIKILKGTQPNAMDSDYYYKQAVDIAIREMQKAIPKEAIEKRGRYDFQQKLMYVVAKCPVCRCEIRNSVNTYCDTCGQLIDVTKWFDGVPDTVVY